MKYPRNMRRAKSAAISIINSRFVNISPRQTLPVEGAMVLVDVKQFEHVEENRPPLVSHPEQGEGSRLDG